MYVDAERNASRGGVVGLSSPAAARWAPREGQATGALGALLACAALWLAPRRR